MIGPFKPAPGNFKFVFVLIDKFFQMDRVHAFHQGIIREGGRVP
jgi:hypothetical protein